MGATAIEWTDETWNVTTGCDRVSPGCDHCYALTMARRLKGMGNPRYQEDGNPTTSGPGFGAAFHEDALGIPSSWRSPRRVFVDSMGDLFHDEIADYQIARVWSVMALHPQHTFQILTKRHARMRSLVGGDLYDLMIRDLTNDGAAALPRRLAWPLPNVWLGVSVENQQWADNRIPALLDTPAAVRFLSCEPLLGPVDLVGVLDDGCQACGPAISHDSYATRTDYGTGVEYSCDHQVGIDWVIAGGESGVGARPMSVDWARSLRDQCITAGVPFLFKQWGAYDDWGRHLSKKLAGRQLDGRTWDEYPAGAA